MRHFLEEYGTIVGLILLAVIVIVLLSSPESIFSNLSTVDTGLNYKTPNEVWVKSRINLTFIQNKTLFTEFPKIIGSWEGVQFHAEEKRAKLVFGTDIVLVRKYYNGERDIQFVFVKGENSTDVIHPVRCFGRSWNVTEQGIESVHPEGWNATVNVNKLYAQSGNATDVVLYWFMWSGAQRSVKNCIMVMVVTPVYYNESENTPLSALKDFSSGIIPRMYEYRPKSDIIGKQLINNFGISGVILEISLIGLSLALVFYNRLWKRR